MKEISAAELSRRLSAGDKIHLIDVREPHEHETFDIGGINIPVTELPFRIEEIRSLGDDEIVLYCQSGNRSMLAQKLLAMQFGIEHTLNLTGGLSTWDV